MRKQTALGLTLITFFALVGDVRADNVISIDLGGLRKVKAALTISDTDYTITMRMLPVKSFDTATNARLNRDKARLYALQALGKYLAGKDTVEMSVSGATVEMSATEDGIYTLTLRVPRKGVSVLSDKGRPSIAKPDKAERFPPASQLLTRKSDVQDTLSGLTRRNEDRIQQLIETDTSKDVQYQEVADIEDVGLKQFVQLTEEVNQDRLLLVIEKDELKEAIHKQEVQLIKTLKQALVKIESKEKKK